MNSCPHSHFGNCLCVLRSYDLATDPSETTNLASKRPDVLNTLLARLRVLAEESVEPMVWDPPFQGDACVATISFYYIIPFICSHD